MTVLLAVRGESFVVLGADRLTIRTETETATRGVIRIVRFYTTKIVVSKDPPLAVATSGWGTLAGGPTRERVAELVGQHLTRHPVDAVDWLDVARVLQQDLRAAVAANHLTSRETLTVHAAAMTGGAPP
jgi:hypothetical protein